MSGKICSTAHVVTFLPQTSPVTAFTTTSHLAAHKLVTITKLLYLDHSLNIDKLAVCVMGCEYEEDDAKWKNGLS